MTTELDQLWADEPANIPPTRDSRLEAAVDHLEQRAGVPHADRDGSEQRVLPPVYRGKAEPVGRSRERELHTYLAADAEMEGATEAAVPDPDRVAQYAEAIDPEAFDLHKKRSKHPAAVIQWTARCHIARESALASITVADAEQEELRAEVQRLRRWKSEALPVMSGLQELGRALGLPLGASITGEMARDAAARAYNRAASAEARADWLAETLGKVRALADELEHNDCACECCSQDETPFSIRAILDADAAPEGSD